MVNNTIQWSGKLGEDILVIGADNPDDFEVNFKALLSDDAWQVMIDQFGQKVSAGIPAPAAARPAAPPANSSAPQCQHGAREWKTGTSKAGKPYKGWFCPADRNDPTKCDVQWSK